MTIERRETRFIAQTEVAPADLDDIEITAPRTRPSSRLRDEDLPQSWPAPIIDAPPIWRDAVIEAEDLDLTIPSARPRLPEVGQPDRRPSRSLTDDFGATSHRSRTSASASPRTTQILERRRLWERRYRRRLRLTDAAVILVATMLPRVIALALGGTAALEGNVGGVASALSIPALVAVAWYAVLGAFRTREASIFGAGSAEYLRLIHATGLAFGGLAILFVIFRADGLRGVLLVALPLGTIMLVAGRWGWRRWLLRERAYGHYVSRTIIVGERDDVRYVIETLHRDGQRGYLVVGAALTGEDSTELRVDGQTYPVLGSPQSAARTAARLGADTIIVASHDDDDPYYVKRLSWQLEGTAAELILSSRLTDVAGPRISLRPVDGLPLIQVKIPSFEGGQYALKRTLDVFVSGLALAAIAVIALPLALAIKIDSRGPVFFRQERVGRDGHRFKMLKFRTMRVGAAAEVSALSSENDGAGPLFKMRNDPRVTRVGRLLRKLSLDELPQFWNVLRGDMSVVGPRPPLPGEVTAYNGAVYRRLYIKPGITGLWQVSGRSDLPWDESVRLDLRYVENWSILSDVIIMWRTVRTMVTAKGAY